MTTLIAAHDHHSDSDLKGSATIQSTHEKVIDAMRAELQEYGGLLNLFDQEQDAILNRDRDTVTEAGLTIEAQQVTLRARRSERENLVAALTPKAEARPPLLHAILHFPLAMRPLVEALATEVNRLIVRVRCQAEVNRMLLVRAFEMIPELCAEPTAVVV
jgi:hypothetical protein